MKSTKGFKKITALILVLALSLSLLAGCGSSSSGTSESSGATTTGDSGNAQKTIDDAQQGAKSSDEFDWKKFDGSTIKVSFVQHAASDAVIAKIPEFEALTGIKVEQSVTPEANYFDKLSTSLSSRSGDPDVFMSGAYQLWDYSTANYIEDLNTYLGDPNMITSDYDFEDLVPSAVSALQWDGVPGHSVGSGPQLGLPLMFEIYTLAYNTRAFKDAGIDGPPETYDELLEICDKLQNWNDSGSYPLAMRGARDWGTIHPGYMSTFANFGAKDFAVEDGKLVSKLNSPESVKMNEYFVDLITRGGAPSWSKYTWYECAADLGAGKAAMMIDADAVTIQQNWSGATQEAGNIAWAPIPTVNKGDSTFSNYWTWSLAMNNTSKNKEAAWYFMLYFTSKDFCMSSSIEGNNLDPVRTSVWESEDFKNKLKDHPGYIEAYNKTIEKTTILFTPQPYFFETTTEWAATLQDMIAGQYKSVQEAMDTLKAKIDKTVEDIEIKE